MTDILADITCYIGLFCLRVVNIIQRREVIGHDLLRNGHICAPVTMYLSKVSYCGVSTAHWLGEAMLLLAVNISRDHRECALLCCLRRNHYFTHVSGSDTSLWNKHILWDKHDVFIEGYGYKKPRQWIRLMICCNESHPLSIHYHLFSLRAHNQTNPQALFASSHLKMSYASAGVRLGS